MKQYFALILIVAVAVTIGSCGRETIVTPISPANGTEQPATPLFLVKTGQVQKTEFNDATGTCVVLGRIADPVKMTMCISDVYGDRSLQIAIRDTSLATGILRIVNSNRTAANKIQIISPREAFIEASIDAAIGGPYISQIDGLLESKGLSFTVGVDDTGNYFLGNRQVTPNLKIWFSFGSNLIYSGLLPDK